jgi:hypothetical protein
MSSSQHKLLVALLTGTSAVAMALTGCAGNGQGLNSSGAPAGSGGNGSSGPLVATWESIQDHVFSPICMPCHNGAGAPEGLMLDPAHSYADLVGMPSTEVPTLDRVKPTDPDNSYIIRKLMGGPGIEGVQMPYGETPLPQSTIDVIRQWITNGAPPPQESTSTATTAEAMLRLQSRLQNTPSTAFSVNFTWPTDAAYVESPLGHILVAFNHEVDASLVNYTNLTVERVGPVGAAISSTQPLSIASHAALAEGNSNAAIITPAAALLPGVYRVTIRGSGGGALADLNAQTLGNDYSFTFTVDGSP